MTDPPPLSADEPNSKSEPGESTVDNCDFYVVGIGASAGGLSPVEELFKALPPDLNAAYIVVQHLSPDFKSHMQELLARQTSMPVIRAENEMTIKPGHVYLIPPKKEMVLSEGRLLLTDKNPDGGLSYPIDLFLRSIGYESGRFGVGVILSGTGSDGSRGIQDIHESGGLVISQDLDSAAFDGMPSNAIATGIVDLTLSPSAIADALSRYIREALTPEVISAKELPAEEYQGLQTIFRLLKGKYAIDFAQYRTSTISRRIWRRMGMRQIREIANYAGQLETDSIELESLYRDLLINVTRFFRDKKAFAALEKQAIPDLVSKASEDETLRIWIAACATGEEAYSIAILLDEQIRQQGRQLRYKIFATDLHDRSLEVAGKGFYSEAALAEVSRERRDRYFVATDDGYHIKSEIRDNIVFAPHNLLQDAPFTQLDLVCCRNLLIYFQPVSQRKVLSLFHFALKAGGYLFLGPSETLGDLTEEFATVDKRWRLYRKRRDRQLDMASSFDLRTSPLRPITRSQSEARGSGRATNAEESIYTSLLHQELPPCFLLDEQGTLLHTFGGGERLLKSRSGRNYANIADLVDPQLKTTLMAAFHQCLQGDQEVIYSNLELDGTPRNQQQNDSDDSDSKGIQQSATERFQLTVRRLAAGSAENEQIFVRFDPVVWPESVIGKTKPRNADEALDIRVEFLEGQLSSAQEDLQLTIEELESSNEELQSTNEELVASNEELQSTNEELHSVNEEMHTVNSEYQKKIEELTQLTEDMDNLYESTEIGVLFLDEQLNIRLFTPSIAKVFNLLPQDIGRAFASFTNSLDEPTLHGDIAAVLETGKATEKRVTDSGGSSYLLGLRPYHSKNATVGVVLTLVNVTQLTKAEGLIAAQEANMRTILNSTAEAIFGLDKQGLCTFANPACIEWLGCDSEAELLGQDMCQFIHRGRDGVTIDESECAICDSLVTGSKLHSEESFFWRKDNTRFPVEYWSHPMLQDGELQGAVVTFFDATERRAEESQLRMHSRMMELSHDAIIVWRADSFSADTFDPFNSPQDTIIAWNRGAEQIYGYRALEAVGQVTHKLLKTKHSEPLQEIRNKMIAEGEWSGRLVHTNREGEQLNISTRHQLMRNADGELLVLEINRDMTEVFDTQQKLTEARIAAEQANLAKSRFLANMSHELRTPLAAILGFTEILGDEVAGEANRERVDTIRRNGSYLLDLLNDLLDLSKIEAGKIDVHETEFDLHKLVLDVASLIQVRADSKDLPFHLVSETPFPKQIVTDPKLLRQILVNLLGNAVKFTEKGEVRWSIGFEDNGSAKPRLVFSVKDTGIGIDNAQLKRIFQPFTQASDKIDARFGGTGLGLSISKLLAAKLGGQIEVKSEVGVGSDFVLRLPISQYDSDSMADFTTKRDTAQLAAPMEADFSELLSGRRVLVADDRRDIRHIAKHFLKKASVLVIEAENGQEAIDKIQHQSEINEPVDLVLMDMQMPVLDGYEATVKLRESGFDKPVIALTASAMKGERDRCLSLGCDDYLSKPVDGPKLIEACCRTLLPLVKEP